MGHCTLAEITTLEDNIGLITAVDGLNDALSLSLDSLRAHKVSVAFLICHILDHLDLRNLNRLDLVECRPLDRVLLVDTTRLGHKFVNDPTKVARELLRILELHLYVHHAIWLVLDRNHGFLLHSGCVLGNSEADTAVFSALRN